jgi:hypothetical protein
MLVVSLHDPSVNVIEYPSYYGNASCVYVRNYCNDYEWEKYPDACKAYVAINLARFPIISFFVLILLIILRVHLHDICLAVGGAYQRLRCKVGWLWPGLYYRFKPEKHPPVHWSSDV